MTFTTEEFASQFHGLSGSTIAEKRKNLFLLLNSTKGVDHTGVDFSVINPKSLLEEKFKVETLIFFKKMPELVMVLQSEHPILIKIILKGDGNFLNELIEHIPNGELVFQVFSNLSLNTKIKLVNKLSLHMKNSQRAEDLFGKIEKRYGLYLAVKLLPACDSNFILNFAKRNKFKPTSKQLLTIIKRYPEIAEELLEILKANNVSTENEYKGVFIHISNTNVPLFLKLYKELGVFPFRLGWRSTERIIKTNQEGVIRDSKFYLKFLHNKQIAKSLKSNFKLFFQNLFPAALEKYKNSQSEILDILKRLPTKMTRTDLLTIVFQQVYGKQLWDFPEYVMPEFLEMLTPHERQIRLKNEYKPEFMSEEQWVCYQKTEKSIAFLKKRISLSADIKMRANLVEYLVETCKINNDVTALAAICKYMVNHHRNDHYSVRLSFLKSLKKRDMLKIFAKEHWDSVNELIKLFDLNNEQFHHIHDFLEAYIYYRFLNNLPVREQLVEWVKLRGDNFNIIKEKPEYEKSCLLIFGELIPEIHKGNDNDLKIYSIAFLSALIIWNKRHPNDLISLFSYKSAFDILKNQLNDCTYSFHVTPIIKYCLQQKTDNEAWMELLKLYMKSFSIYSDVKIISNLIRNEPTIILENIEELSRLMFKSYLGKDYFFWKHCQYYSHLNLPNKIVEICLTVLNENVEDDNIDVQIENIMTALSFLMPPNEFLEFIMSKYSLKIKKEENPKMYKSRKQIGIVMKNVLSPSMTFTIISLLSRNFLRTIIPSVYSIADKANENQFSFLLEELFQYSPSVRKHALHLTFRISNKDRVHAVTVKFMDMEKNAVIRRSIFQGCIKFFIKNADYYSLQLLKLNFISNIKNNNVIEILMNIDKIPNCYIKEYTLFIWAILNKINISDSERNYYTAILLNSISSDTIKLLLPNFCAELLTIHLFQFTTRRTNFQTVIQYFACKYIIYCNSRAEQKQRLKQVFESLRAYVLFTQETPETKFEGYQTATKFLKIFCLEIISKNIMDKQLLLEFSQAWRELFTPDAAFDAYLRLELTQIYLEKLSLPEIGEKILALCDLVTSLYGPIVIKSFSNQVQSFLKHFINEVDEEVSEKNRFVLFDSLVKPDGNSLYHLLLLILLLNNNYPTLSSTKIKYNAFISMLEKQFNPTIQVYLNNHFREIEAVY